MASICLQPSRAPCCLALLMLALIVPVFQLATGTKLACIGDFGAGTTAETNVANMVKGWGVDAIFTTGDNCYSTGQLADFSTNVGRDYHSFIYPYHSGSTCGTSPCGASDGVNKFWPAPGNHDWGNTCPGSLSGYTTFFTLPNNERYYDKVVGNIHLFALDSDCNEPNGLSSTSTQATWLQGRLAASTSPWKLVYMHHPPYSSGDHGSSTTLRWPYQSWGASAVLAGHDHSYERVLPLGNGYPYFINGLGGASKYAFGTIVAGSQVRYNADYGAMLIESTTTTLTFKFLSLGNVQQDCYKIDISSGSPVYSTCTTSSGNVYSLVTGAQVTAPSASPRRTWKYYTITGSTAPPTSWNTVSYSDGAWASGVSPLGYGPDLAWGTTLSSSTSGTGGGSYLFRYKFCLSSADDTALASKTLTLTVASDNRAQSDVLQVWLNGASVLSEASTVDHEIAYWNNQVSVAGSSLVAGANVIAVRVYNTAGSSDAGFDLDLRFSGTGAVAIGCP